MQPAVGFDRLGRRRLVAVIAHHHERPRDHQLADLAGRQLPRGVLGVDDPGPVVEHVDADRAQPVLAVAVLHHRRAGGLGHAPQLVDRAARAGGPFLRFRDRHRLAADHGAGQRRQVEGLEFGMRQHVEIHRRHAVGDGDPVFLDRRQHLAGVEPFEQDQRRAEQEAEIEDRRPVDMRARQRRGVHVGPGPHVHRRGDRGVQDDAAMAQHRAFGEPGGPRGVADLRQRPGVGLGRGDSGRVAVDQRLERGGPVHAGAEDDDPGEAPGLLERQDRPRPVGGGNQRLRAAILDHIGDLIGRQHDVDRIDDRAEPSDRVIAHHPFPAVLGVERHPVAGGHAQPRQPGGEPAGQVVDLRIGEAPPAENQRRAVAEPGRRLARDPADGLVQHRPPSLSTPARHSRTKSKASPILRT